MIYIPSYFKIEILAIRDEFVTQGHKGLSIKFSPHLQELDLCAMGGPSSHGTTDLTRAILSRQ